MFQRTYGETAPRLTPNDYLHLASTFHGYVFCESGGKAKKSRGDRLRVSVYWALVARAKWPGPDVLAPSKRASGCGALQVNVLALWIRGSLRTTGLVSSC